MSLNEVLMLANLFLLFFGVDLLLRGQRDIAAILKRLEERQPK